MRKLTIKEIAPYLPYKLRVFDQWSEESQGEFLEVHGFDGDMQEWLLYDNIDGSTINYCKSLVKMVLRPLSEYKKFDDILDEMSIVDQGHVEEGFVKQLPYSVMEKMFEHHIDVFYLINKNLAIDINTLKE